MNKSNQFVGILALVVISFWLIGTLLVAYDDYKVIAAHGIIGVILVLFFLFCGGLRLMFSNTSRKVIGFGGSLFIYSALFLSIIASVNYIAYNHEFFSYDSTEQKVYTLALQTINVLESVKEPLVIRAFFVGGIIKDRKVEDLLNRVSKHSKFVSWGLIDPEQEPTLVQKYSITQNATIHLSYAGKDKRSVLIVPPITEQEITNAILKITKNSAKKIYYITGHDEPKLTDDGNQSFLFAKKAIEGENFILEPLSLANADSIPADSSCVILMAPKKFLSEKEMATITEFIRHGGNALFLHEPKTSDDISKIASQFGIVVGNDVIVDKVVKLYDGASLGVQPVVQDYGQHPITKDFKQNTLFSIVASVSPKESLLQASQKDAKLSIVASTSKDSWAEANLDLLFGEESITNLDDNDLTGPVPIAVSYEKPLLDNNKDAEKNTNAKSSLMSRVVVVGDADFATNLFIHQFGNRDFLLNIVNWIVGESEKISIRPRTLKQATDSISMRQANMMFLVAVIIIPEILLIIGLRVWWNRR